MVKVCSKVPKLAMPAELPIAEKIHHMATGFHTAQEEAAKAQWELNLQIAEVRLTAQPTTPPEVREQCRRAIQAGLEVIERTVHDCMGLLDQSLIMVTSLQEDPTLQQVEIKARELQ